MGGGKGGKGGLRGRGTCSMRRSRSRSRVWRREDVRRCQISRGQGFNTKETVVGVFVAGEADGGEVVVVHPDAGRGVNVDQIFAFGSSVELMTWSVTPEGLISSSAYLEVADDHIVGLPDLKAAVGETSRGSDTKYGSVADDLDDATAGKGALDLDDTAVLSSGSQTSTVRHGSTSTTAASCGSCGEANQFINSGSSLLHGSS